MIPGMQPLEREPAWLVAAIDQDIQRIKATLAFARRTLPVSNFVLVMLNDHETVGMSEAQFMEWNEVCDGCRRHFPRGDGLLYTYVMRDWSETTKAAITFAACSECLAKP